MPSPTTAIDLITRAMKLAKVISSGETPTAEESNDALAMLNDILENWSTESLSVWASANDVVATVGGQATYTVGPTGNFNITRPRTVDGAYITLQGVDFPVQPIGQLEFNAISLKAQQCAIPQFLLYVADFPLGSITLWPVPSQASPLTLSTPRLLTQIPALATAINYPPGAVKSLLYSLAIELATAFGAPLGAAMLALAADAKADYKRANKVPVRSYCDAALLGGRFINWRIGY